MLRWTWQNNYLLYTVSNSPMSILHEQIVAPIFFNFLKILEWVGLLSILIGNSSFLLSRQVLFLQVSVVHIEREWSKYGFHARLKLSILFICCFFLGVVEYNGLRIGGLSGIYKGTDYLKGRFECPPYNPSSMRSVYHIRTLDVFRLRQLGSRPGFEYFLLNFF